MKVLRSERAPARHGSRVAAHEREILRVVQGGKILCADGGHAVEIGEIVQDKIARLAKWQIATTAGIDNAGTAPSGQAVGVAKTAGISLGGQFGHRVFVDNIFAREVEKLAKLTVKILFFEFSLAVFVTASFEEMATDGKGNRRVIFHKMQEGQSSSHEDEWGGIFFEMR